MVGKPITFPNNYVGRKPIGCHYGDIKGGRPVLEVSVIVNVTNASRTLYCGCFRHQVWTLERVSSDCMIAFPSRIVRISCSVSRAGLALLLWLPLLCVTMHTSDASSVCLIGVC